MNTLDLAIVAVYLLSALAIGLAVTKKASQGSEEYFLAGRSLPWWLAGTSMVATTFAADTPLAVTGLVASGGIAGNWVWWCVGIAHVVTAVLFARWWRRLEVVTDAEIMERRYTGKAAPALRLVKAGYAAILVNCLTMGWVILAMRKVCTVLFPEQDPLLLTFGLMALAVLYSSLGGMRSVVLTDLAQFGLALFGACLLCFIVVRDEGGLSGLVAGLHEAYPDRAGSMLAFLPEGDLPGLPITLFAVLLSVGWWRQAEGSGYIMQRLGASSTPQDAERAAIWFAVLHNAIRPWPWILVGLAALVVYPLTMDVDREATYAMLLVDRLPAGALGLMIASLLAAFMSTIDTHVNWGSSYVVRDLWLRFVDPQASPRRQVLVGRIAVVLLGALAAIASLGMNDIASVWLFVIMLGSGLGSVSLARWLWWRVNAAAELTALVASSLLALAIVLLGNAAVFGVDNPLFWQEIPTQTRILVVAFGSLACWIPVTLVTQPDGPEMLDAFYRQVRPWGFWGPVAERNPGLTEPMGLLPLRLVAGLLSVFGTLFGLGGLLLEVNKLPWLALALVGLGSFAWMMWSTSPDAQQASDRG